MIVAKWILLWVLLEYLGLKLTTGPEDGITHTTPLFESIIIFVLILIFCSISCVIEYEHHNKDKNE